MKRLLQLMLMMLPLAAVAQSEAESLLSAGKTWVMCYTADEPKLRDLKGYVEQMLGDEIVKDNISFRQILERQCSIEGEQCPPPDFEETDNYVGQDTNGKVYYYWGQYDVYIVVMDFSLKEGDTYFQKDTEGYVWDEFVVTKVSEENFSNHSDGKPRKCICLSSVHNYPLSDVWIEGVGSIYGGLKGASFFQWVGGGMSLYQCRESGSVIYQSPQSTTGINGHRSDIATEKAPMYNLHGQRLNVGSQKGIYIQNGKKVVVK